ncbi:MAG: hypothetical protein COU51_04750 [Parcubacteria group bacterium CG10_big_fil_rev_8_21_14_0_10_36_14]|nr:MAG: hypothetical protein COU51_04750 [Parcubacteria group bacterium CG10_big_fil_rev_8_21_14_0_10_36_14]
MIKNVIVASGAVIIKEGKVFLNKHGEDKFWKFLGGKVEERDFSNSEMSLEEACRREVKEENGFDIEIISPLKPMMVPKPGSEDTYVVLIHFLAKKIGEIKPGDIDEFREFEIEKILNGEYGEEFAPNILPVLKSYLGMKKAGLIK